MLSKVAELSVINYRNNNSINLSGKWWTFSYAHVAGEVNDIPNVIKKNNETAAGD